MYAPQMASVGQNIKH